MPQQLLDSQESDDEQESATVHSCSGCCCSCVPAGSVGVVQRFGEFVGYQEPGLSFFCIPFESVKYVSCAVQQMDCTTDCKTKDNVTLTVKTAVQYRVNKQMIKAAVFDIIDPRAQINALVDNIVRSSLPAMDLDDAYSAKDSLCGQILNSVRDAMSKYGYTIINVLVTDLSPEASVLQAMNAINAARRHREAAIEQGEAQKALTVKAAEASARAQELSGVGLANMRKAMADGFKDSMASMSHGGLGAPDAMHMMITTQYLDTLKSFADNPTTSAIMVPHGPGAVKDIEAQVRDGFLVSQSMTRGAGVPQQSVMR